MNDADLVDQAARLRTEGHSVKKIARLLGLSPTAAADLVNRAAEAPADHPIGSLVGCWISSGWSDGLTLADPERWTDTQHTESGADGLVAILIARSGRDRRVLVTGYLIDVYCLGVKSVLGPDPFDTDDVPGFIDQYFSAYSSPPLSAPLELAQHLVHGAVAYAASLGFRPAPGYRASLDELGPAVGPGGIEFGRNGKPYYVQGPRDDARSILRTLDRTVGPANYEYLIVG